MCDSVLFSLQEMKLRAFATKVRHCILFSVPCMHTYLIAGECSIINEHIGGGKGARKDSLLLIHSLLIFKIPP